MPLLISILGSPGGGKRKTFFCHGNTRTLILVEGINMRCNLQNIEKSKILTAALHQIRRFFSTRLLFLSPLN